ncbi:MAG: hypothetical protein M1429_00830 [Patescibacteria group bacterium]|nr:hypothetical protein [Patescibacteria group bacterium]
MKKTVWAVILVIMGLFFVVYFRGEKYPRKQVIESTLFEPPVQNEVENTPFDLDYKGFKYKLTPRYEYSLYGMVLAYHYSDSWIDISHKNDPYNTEDICVMWGRDINTEIYRKMKFSHGDWTCYADFKSSASSTDYQQFNSNEISNNHLIPANDYINGLMRQAKNGDQIYIKGYLVDYEVFNTEGQKVGGRQTSTTVEDQKCEVIYVTDFKILKKYTFLEHLESGVGLK